MHYVCFFFFFFILFRYKCAWYRTTEKDGDDGRDLSLIELYTRFFPFVFPYVKYIEFDSRFLDLFFYFHSFFLLTYRARCVRVIQIIRSFSPPPPFFTYTSAFPSFRRRRVRGLISISLRATHPTIVAAKSSVRIGRLARVEARSRGNLVSSTSPVAAYSLIVSFRNVFVRRVARYRYRSPRFR